ELDVAIAVDSPPPLREFGKRAVLEQLQSIGPARRRPEEQLLEVFASGERVVALRDEPLTIDSALALRSLCVLVFVRRGDSIARLGIRFELRPAVQTRRQDRADQSKGRVAAATGSRRARGLPPRAMPPA